MLVASLYACERPLTPLQVEHVIKEQNMVDVFVMSEHYCQLLIERFVLLDHK